MTPKNVEVMEISDSEDLGSWVRFSKTETETLLCPLPLLSLSVK
jgi:hypothetical protein